MKLGTLLALISKVAPVCGLRPVRAARSFTLKVPKPTSVTVSPDLSASVIEAIVASKALPASVLDNPPFSAIASIYSEETARDIADSEIDLMEEFELGVILSPARRNGAFSMLKTIKEFSKKLAN